MGACSHVYFFGGDGSISISALCRSVWNSAFCDHHRHVLVSYLLRERGREWSKDKCVGLDFLYEFVREAVRGSGGNELLVRETESMQFSILLPLCLAQLVWRREVESSLACVNMCVYVCVIRGERRRMCHLFGCNLSKLLGYFSPHSLCTWVVHTFT